MEVPSRGEELEKLIDYEDVSVEQARSHRVLLESLNSVEFVVKGSRDSTHVVRLSV
jgi:hypothetical protein